MTSKSTQFCSHCYLPNFDSIVTTPTTVIAVSHSTQQRLVHRYAFEELPSNPEVEVEEMSLDGGKVRLRTAKGKALIWRDYKAVSFHQLGVAAFFQDNSA